MNSGENGDRPRRGGDRGGRRRDENGDGDGGNGNDDENKENGEEKTDEPPKERYVPEEIDDDKLFEERTEHYGTGINFDKFDNIPIFVSHNF